MNILAVGCIHNDVENLLTFIERIGSLDFDAVVCPGDFTDSFLPRGFTRKDVGLLVIEELRSLGKPLFVVPGSWDKELIEVFEEEKISVHGAGKIYKSFGFYGFGGAKTPFNLPFEPSDGELYKGLASAYKSVEGAEIKVQVTHAPPVNTKLDMIPGGAHVGSESVRKIIDEMRPDIAICSHIHEARGFDVIGKTHAINCGRLPEGYCGLIKIHNGQIKSEIISLI